MVSIQNQHTYEQTSNAALQCIGYFSRMEPEKMITTREAAELAEVSIHTVRAWIMRGKIQASSYFGRRLIDREYFLNWLENERKDNRFKDESKE